MIAEEKAITTISKKNDDFPDYLDFEKLRRESIEYIGKLSGKIWTDHNVHDPGITILEVLCYALLDLGYRTHLPVEDILAKNPADGNDTNFFTPAQILSCNPLTIIDYRKLLIGIPDVKNAWLSVSSEETDNPDSLNGLYHVSIELEKYPDPDDKIDINVFAASTLKKVKSVLMAHRNFCEDFLDVTVLCQFEVGVCASIELEDDAEAETVYTEMVEKLNNFFSPAPRFYTLQQLLDKNLPIDDIFAGRPYNKTESSGFIDTMELDAIKLRAEIHTSDVYNVLFQVKGIKKITSLQLNSKSPSSNRWKMGIPLKSIPSFSVAKSRFEFKRNGLPVTANTKKFDALFELGFTNGVKTVYLPNSPYLDLALPVGNYSETLGDYYSIQNDFPEVYGIGKGDLPENATPEREAKALQLKGYLLFFDQLLANYLSQLQNIRNLFSLSSPENKKDRHTYFFNQLKTVPDLDKLLRFSDRNATLVGADGATLAFPVSAVVLEQLKTFKGNMQDRLASLTPFEFTFISEVNDVIQLLQNDLIANTRISTQTWCASDGSWCYAVIIPDAPYALLCKKTFRNEQDAKHHAASVQYTAIHKGNYRQFITPADLFSFEIEFNITSYTGYLGLLLEDETLYHDRRKDFLNHLLSRFAEKFTDFALLNWQDEHAITSAENFLTHYDELSRNRGRAYDYQRNGWNSTNASGFEKKVKALSGLSQDTATLCNFVVESCEEHFTVALRADKEEVVFASEQKFDSHTEAENAAAAMIKALADRTAYQTQYFGHEKKYRLKLNYGYATPATHPLTFTNSQHADQLAAYLVQSVNPAPVEKDTIISSYIWKSELRNYKNELVATSATVFKTATEAHTNGLLQVDKTSDPEIWNAASTAEVPLLHVEKINEQDVLLIENSVFKIEIHDNIIGKPGQFTYDLLDTNNTFKLCPNQTFASKKAAEEHAHIMLAAAADMNNWQLEDDFKTKNLRINICRNGIAEASFVTQPEEVGQAEQQVLVIYELIKKHIYTLTASEHPDKWKFTFTLGYEEENTWIFESDQEYATCEDANQAALAFYKGVGKLTLVKGITLRVSDGKLSSVSLAKDKKGTADPEQKLNALVQQQKVLSGMFSNVESKQLNKHISSDLKGEQAFLYRLINTDHIPAKSKSPVPPTNDPQSLKRKTASAYKQQQWFPSICLGGDIYMERKDAEGNTRYHYEIRFRNLPFAGGHEIPLFTSTMGYTTPEKAEQAFRDNYLQLLQEASKATAYGTVIALEPIYFPQSGKTVQANALVFIPIETMQLFTANFKENWKTEMVHLAEAYPVKIIKPDSEEFADFFCQEILPENTGSVNNLLVKSFYYFKFSLYNKVADIADVEWISTNYFQTPEEAMQEFLYFNRLLDYTGNWYIDCYNCALTKKSEQRFFIHEVLAESINCFPSKNDAWGPQGVEAFICAVQSGKSIHNYINKTDCCYSFYVDCGGSPVIHPCTYDTSSKQEEAMNELYNRLKKMKETNAFAIVENNDGIVLNNKDGLSLARLRNGKQACDLGINLAETIRSEKSKWEPTEGGYSLTSADEVLILDSETTNALSLDEWKAMVEEWACFFPLVRGVSDVANVEGQTGSIYKYCIEIKIPGFSTCGPNQVFDQPCICSDPVNASQDYCYIAWKSSCCFDSCDEANNALIIIYKLLEDFKNYQPVFDCKCATYGIALTAETVSIENGKGSIISGQVIARNPQCYQTPEEVCRAAEDAKQLTNAAGLHVVEHILLRPHCQENESCRINDCNTYSNCIFPLYEIDDADPCVKEQPVPFNPGTDPYSFIATVALPAWSSVYNNQDKREQAEHVLYSEAPAHVLLRVLWMSPIDFYNFELNFKEWKKWLAKMLPCNPDFTNCDFFDLVLKTEYNWLPNCDMCLPCIESRAKVETTPCVNIETTVKDKSGFLNLVNDVFCMHPSATEVIKVDDDVSSEIRGAKFSKKLVKEIKPSKQEKKDQKKEKKTEQITEEKRTAPVRDTEVNIDPKEKAKFINSRHNKYLQLVKNASERTHGNPIVIKAGAFIQNNKPAADRLEILIKEILGNAKPGSKKIKLLTKEHTEDLLRATICHYLDQIAFNDKEVEKMTALLPVINQLKKVKTDLLRLYNYWDPDAISAYEPGLDYGIVKKLFTGK